MSFLEIRDLDAGYGKAVVLRDVTLSVEQENRLRSLAAMALERRRFSNPSSAARRSKKEPSRSMAIASTGCRAMSPFVPDWRSPRRGA